MSLQDFQVDVDVCETCREQLVALLNAYQKLIAGQARIRVRFDRRWTEYHPGSASQLKQLYCMLFDACPDTAGLLDLRPRRGRGPMYLRIT